MIGYIVRHRQLGLGKIETAQNGAFSIRFVDSGQVLPFGYAQFGKDGSLVRDVLGLGSRCRTALGDCVIERVAKRPPTPAEPCTYTVMFGDGNIQVMSEQDLQPVSGGESADPQVRLGGLQVQPYPLFASREKLRRAYARMLRDTGGLRALLSSRIDLRPHQAFVAGTVLLDPRRRFILADEVGLGKTIEAGIVIHDLLAQKADARILVLCPGALTQQWLSELYAKFGGQLFTLLDLHDPTGVEWPNLCRVIASMTMAAFKVGPALEQISWDMLVVDEVHHLLTMPTLYSLVERLSRRTPAVLLLSAIPAHERADELLRLLALLEPDRYGDVTPAARARFADLHEQQPVIGKGLRVLERRIAALEAGEIEAGDTFTVARRLLETPAISTDRDLRRRLDNLQACTEPMVEQATEVFHICSDNRAAPLVAAPVEVISLGNQDKYEAPLISAPLDMSIAQASNDSNEQRVTVQPSPEVNSASAAGIAADVGGAARGRRTRLAKALRSWAHDGADRYRLSRRILRNRRIRLIEQQQIAPIERKVRLRPYAPHPLELESADALEALLNVARDRCRADSSVELLASFARLAWQSAASPFCLARLLSALARATPATLNEQGLDFLAMGQAVGYADWALYRDLLVKKVRSMMPADLLDGAIQAAMAWQAAGSVACSRFQELLDFLAPLASERPKLILFAGYPGLAAEVAGLLEEAFGADAVATFRSEQSMETKEANALRFQRETAVWLLVSDESGGEGRNFQFAAELVHIDTPWHVARVEQRIGRLDRLGREHVRDDVISTVLYNDASVEAGLVYCYDQALGVYQHSISGLEFALRDVERAVIADALSGGLDAMINGATALVSLVRQERERDDAEAVLDEASYEASSAGRFCAITRSDRVDVGIESAMFDYMRQLTEGRGVRKLDTSFGPGTIIRFQPEKTCFGALPVDEDGTAFLGGNYDGTFRRTVAQQAPRLHFFNIGDPLFNAVIRSLDRHATGRVFAIELLTPGRAPWVGLECRFTPTLDSAMLGDSAGLRNRRDSLFVPKPLAVLVDLQGTICSEADALVTLRRRLETAQHGQSWWDLFTSGQALARALDTDTWPDAVASLVEQARSEAVRMFSEQLSSALAAEQTRIAAIIEVLNDAATRGDDEAISQAREYATYANALPKWGATLDAVGLLSINGRLRQGQLE